MSDQMFDEVGVKPGSPYKFGDWKQYAVHNDKEIKGFFGDFRWLSNFFECPVEYEGDMYISSENSFQAGKIIKSERHFLQTCKPYESKRIWKNLTRIDPDAKSWDTRKLRVMTEVTIDKYMRNIDLREKLLATGEKFLEESNHWSDTCWGVDIHKGGENQLGKLLMNVRAFLRGK